MRVAILGLGNMGHAFASRALDRGHQLTVWNRSAGRAGELVAAGATEAGRQAEAVAGAEVVLVSLADDAAVTDICLGADGALAALPEDASLANLSTVAPQTARRLAAAGPAGRVLDAPVMGAPAAIARGDGRFLIGGPAETVERLEPLWDDLGAGYVHCGPAGSGATMKLVSNLLLITGVTALAEAIATARGQGVTDELLRTVFGNSGVLSPASRMRLDSLLDDDHPGWFAPALARKDVRLAIGLAEEAGVPARIGPATEQLLTGVIDTGDRWQDFAAVIEALRPRAGGDD
jgi:3-hydroxyisobutyrate dehydrogenase-like beta-hydroxyacid dehydrogenase